MGDVAVMLGDCPDAVTITYQGVSTTGLWLTRVKAESGENQLAVEIAGEHLVIETGSLPGLARKALISITESADYGGATHSRRITVFRPKDDDRALTRIFLERP